MKLNCDMGESFGSWEKGQDAAVMPHIDMANIACGFHASDPVTMDKTICLALAQGTEIGAHPGYPDLLGFGRREMNCSERELKTLFIYQVAALVGLCQSWGAKVTYVKPHGALYNSMMRDHSILQTLMSALAEYDSSMALLVQADPQRETILDMAEATGIKVLFEAFADRAYTAEGQLASRNLPGAVLHDQADIERHVKDIVLHHRVKTLDGTYLPMHADTICVHGDNLHAVEAVKQIRQLIDSL